MKKIISIFLALVIIMTAIPIAPVPVAGRVVSDTDDEEEYILLHPSQPDLQLT